MLAVFVGAYIQTNVCATREFEWDPKKAKANHAHHGIDFEVEIVYP
jgi:hypothetical protein